MTCYWSLLLKLVSSWASCSTHLLRPKLSCSHMSAWLYWQNCYGRLSLPMHENYPTSCKHFNCSHSALSSSSFPLFSSQQLTFHLQTFKTDESPWERQFAGLCTLQAHLPWVEWTTSKVDCSRLCNAGPALDKIQGAQPSAHSNCPLSRPPIGPDIGLLYSHWPRKCPAPHAIRHFVTELGLTFQQALNFLQPLTKLILKWFGKVNDRSWTLQLDLNVIDN